MYMSANSEDKNKELPSSPFDVSDSNNSSQAAGGSGTGTGSGASWTIVANITPSYDTNNCHFNNTCPNGSLTSTSSSNATTTQQYNIIPSHGYHKNYSNDRTQGALGYKFNSRASDYGKHRGRHHAHRHSSDSDGAFGGRGSAMAYEEGEYNRSDKADNGNKKDNKVGKDDSLLSGKPPDTPYTTFAPTNKPRSPYLDPRPYNSLMDLFR